MSSLVNDNFILRRLQKEGLIKFTRCNSDLQFKYIDEVEGIGMRFTCSKGFNYQLKYHDGCFYPYVYIINLKT